MARAAGSRRRAAACLRLASGWPPQSGGDRLCCVPLRACTLPAHLTTQVRHPWGDGPAMAGVCSSAIDDAMCEAVCLDVCRGGAACTVGVDELCAV
eukprot:1856189-Prymnesium_polylepis.2